MAVFARSGEQASSRRRGPWKLLLAPLVVLVMALGFAVAAEAAYAQRALPGMSVGGIAIGSLEKAALRDRLDHEIAAPWAGATVTLAGGERSWRATNADLGIAPDLDAAVAAALAYGKTGGVLDRLGAWSDALRGDANIPFTMRSRGDALDRWVAAAARDTDRAPVSGELRVSAKGLEATKPALGREVDRVATVASLLSADSLGDREVTLRVRFAYPAVDASGFDDAYALASAIVTPLTVAVEDRTWNESATGLASLLIVERIAARAGELPAIPREAIAPSARYRYAVSLANDLPTLAELRRTMRQRLVASDLLDAARFSREFESVIAAAHADFVR